LYLQQKWNQADFGRKWSLLALYLLIYLKLTPIHDKSPLIGAYKPNIGWQDRKKIQIAVAKLSLFNLITVLRV